MATNTYVALDAQTLVSATNIVTFTSIPSTYTNLVLVINTTNSESTSQPYIQFNSDTSGSSTNYSTTSIRGDGSNGASSRHSNNFGWYPVPGPGVGTNGNFEPWIVNISNYSNTSVFKSAVSRFNNAVSIVSANTHLWRSQSAISSITIKMESGNFNIGSTFSVYGIRAEGVLPSVKATGGVISSDSTYYYHTFPATGVFTPSQSLTCDYFIVAGGGGAGATTGGGWAGGGGGAGGYRTFTGVSFASGTSYTATVGAGGNGGSGSGGTGGKGNNSSLIGGAISTTTTGGGGGGTTEVNGSTKTSGQAGGSGGGGAQTQTSVSGGAGNEGGYTPVEGFAGRSTTGNPGQGGGAGGVGLDSVYPNAPTPNGVTAFDSNYYASGGTTLFVSTGSQNGSAFTGNGGSSRNDGTGQNVTGGTGGSGIVVIRYLKA